MHRIVFVVVLFGILSSQQTAPAQDSNYALTVAQECSIGDRVRVDVTLDNSGLPIRAWSFGVCHDEATLDLTEVANGSATLTVNGGQIPAFNGVNIAPMFGGGFTVGAVVDFDNVFSLPAGSHELYTAEYQYVVVPGTETDISICDTLGSPTVPILIGLEDFTGVLPTTAAIPVVPLGCFCTPVDSYDGNFIDFDEGPLGPITPSVTTLYRNLGVELLSLNGGIEIVDTATDLDAVSPVQFLAHPDGTTGAVGQVRLDFVLPSSGSDASVTQASLVLISGGSGTATVVAANAVGQTIFSETIVGTAGARQRVEISGQIDRIDVQLGAGNDRFGIDDLCFDDPMPNLTGLVTAVPGRLLPSNYREGAAGVAYVDTTFANLGNAGCEPGSVDLCPIAGNECVLCWTANGEWVEYSVQVAQSGFYDIGYAVASPLPNPGVLRLDVDGTPQAPFSPTTTGGWSNFQVQTQQGVFLAAGSSVLRLNIVQAGCNLRWIDFTLVGVPLPCTPEIPIPGRVEAEDYRSGGVNVAYRDTTPGNTGGACRFDDVDLELANDVGGGCNLGWTIAGEWVEYCVQVATTGVYDVDFRVASNVVSGGALRLELDGNDVTGTVPVLGTGGWQVWQTITISNVTLPAGSHTLRLQILDSDFNLNWIEFRVPCPPPTIAPPQLPAASVGVSYQEFVTETGAVAPVQWSLTGLLPPGLDFDPATAEIHGTPTTPGSYCIVVQACGADGCCASRDYCIDVACPDCPQVSILPNGSFEEGALPWRFYSNGNAQLTLQPGMASPQAARVAIQLPGTNVQLYQSGIAVTAGETYTVSFRGSSSSGHDLRVRMHLHQSPWSNLGLNQFVDLGTSEQLHSFEFTANETTDNARFSFWFADHDAAGDQYWIDDVILALDDPTPVGPATMVRVETAADGSGTVVGAQTVISGASVTLYAVSRAADGQWVGNPPALWSLTATTGGVNSTDLVVAADGRSAVFTGSDRGSTQVTASSGALLVVPTGTLTVEAAPMPQDNALANGDFENGSTPWRFYSNGNASLATISVGGSDVARVAIQQPGTNVQLYQPAVELTAGETYTVSFRAYSNTGHDVRVRLHLHTSPWTNLGLNQLVNLTGTWQQFTLQFTATQTTANARFSFWLAPFDASGDQYFIDDVVVGQ
ncbi:MAG: carbohydrate-binding protein [Planctomycetota bacterium]